MPKQENKEKVLNFEVFSDLTARLRLRLDAELSRRKLLLAVSIITTVVVVVVNNWPDVLEWANSIAAPLM